MQVIFLVNGKTEMPFIEEGCKTFEDRIKRYLPFQTRVIPALKNTKNLSPDIQKNQEASLILKSLLPMDFVVLLDEKGDEFRSAAFAEFIQKQMNKGIKRLVFVVGGPYGFDQSIYQRANAQLSLSQMTFSHQLIRLIFMEQLYRALTILKGEPYHNE